MLPNATATCLRVNELYRLEHLVGLTDAELLTGRNLGRVKLCQIRAIVPSPSH